MVRKQKETVLHHSKKLKPSIPAPGAALITSPNVNKAIKPHKKKVSTKTKLREMEANANSEDSKKIKEAFRSAMATVMVGILNPYRKPDCKEGRITATEDFKHLARKVFENFAFLLIFLCYCCFFVVNSFCDAQRTEALR